MLVNLPVVHIDGSTVNDDVDVVVEEFDPPTDVALVEEALNVSNIPPEAIALVLANYTKICVKFDEG